MSPRRPYPKIFILNREDAEAFVAEPTDVCISIRAPRSPTPKLSPAFGAVLWLSFDDVAGVPKAFLETHPNLVPPSQWQVDAIADFALTHRDAMRMVIHCEAGISRSLTVGLAISSKLSRRWAYPRWYRRGARTKKEVHWRDFFDAITAAIDLQRRKAHA